MTPELWIAAIGLVLTFLTGAVAAATRALVKAPLDAKIEGLSEQIKRLEHDLDRERGRADELRASFDQDLKDERARMDEVKVRSDADLKDARERYEQAMEDLTHWKTGRGGAVLLKNEIDAELQLAMNRVGATAATVFAPAPNLQPPSFVFLSVFGARAPELRVKTLPATV